MGRGYKRMEHMYIRGAFRWVELWVKGSGRASGYQLVPDLEELIAEGRLEERIGILANMILNNES
jgi:hypothetical protein